MAPSQDILLPEPFPFGSFQAPPASDGWEAPRKAALEKFLAVGFPTGRDETWKNTFLDGLLKARFSDAAPAALSIDPSALADRLGLDLAGADLLVMVNGGNLGPAQAGELPPGTILKGILEAEKDGAGDVLGKVLKDVNRGFSLLNLARFRGGWFLRVPEGQSLRRPLHVVHVIDAKAGAVQNHLRNAILLGKDSSATVVEHFLGEGAGAYFTGSVTEAVLDKGARLEHSKIQRESDKAYHIGTLSVRQEEKSRLTSRVFSFGGALGRSEVETFLAGRGAECVLEGLYLAKGKQQSDHRTFIDHAVPSCRSEELYKGVLDGEAVGIFDGRVLVRENAQKTDARQANKNLQLTRESRVYSKPQLRIYADDVKCAHGSATGQLDEEALFYLRSRGLGLEQARGILVHAFAGEMVDRAGEGLREPLRRMVDEWMGITERK